MLMKIVSGGQTGVDRGALDAALDADFRCGGWCPESRKAEDGQIPGRYPVSELAGAGYRQRTRQNVIDSDGTLVITFGPPAGGTLETIRFADRFSKPLLVVDGAATKAPTAAQMAARFVEEHSIGVLNVAGKRESGHRGSAAFAYAVMIAVLAEKLSPDRE